MENKYFFTVVVKGSYSGMLKEVEAEKAVEQSSIVCHSNNLNSILNVMIIVMIIDRLSRGNNMIKY